MPRAPRRRPCPRGSTRVPARRPDLSPRECLPARGIAKCRGSGRLVQRQIASGRRPRAARAGASPMGRSGRGRPVSPGVRVSRVVAPPPEMIGMCSPFDSLPKPSLGVRFEYGGRTSTTSAGLARRASPPASHPAARFMEIRIRQGFAPSTKPVDAPPRTSGEHLMVMPTSGVFPQYAENLIGDLGASRSPR